CRSVTAGRLSFKRFRTRGTISVHGGSRTGWWRSVARRRFSKSRSASGADQFAQDYVDVLEPGHHWVPPRDGQVHQTGRVSLPAESAAPVGEPVLARGDRAGLG